MEQTETTQSFSTLSVLVGMAAILTLIGGAMFNDFFQTPHHRQTYTGAYSESYSAPVVAGVPQESSDDHYRKLCADEREAASYRKLSDFTPGDFQRLAGCKQLGF